MPFRNCCVDNVEYAGLGNKNRKYIVNKKTDIKRLLEVDHGCRSNDLQI